MAGKDRLLHSLVFWLSRDSYTLHFPADIPHAHHRMKPLLILTGEGGLVKASSYDGHEEYLPESAVYSYPLIARKLANATGGLYLPSQKRPYAALTPYDDFLRIIGCNGDSPLLDALRQERQFVREHACIHSEKEKVQVTGPL